MTTQILKPAENKALKLGIGLSTGYLALSILITVYFGSEYKDRINSTKNHSTEKTKHVHVVIPTKMRK